MASERTTTTKRRNPRCAFRFSTSGIDGHEKIQTAWAKVMQSGKLVDLILHPEDVRRSMELEGVGNTQTCSMAVCTVKQAKAFSHPVVGYVVWLYRTCYVASKLDKNGWPSECYRYLHNDEIARLNDSKGGQRKLLAELERDGPRLIRLRPRKRKDKTKRGGSGRTRDGTRSGGARLVGAKLRAAVAQLGGVPPG